MNAVCCGRIGEIPCDDCPSASLRWLDWRAAQIDPSAFERGHNPCLHGSQEWLDRRRAARLRAFSITADSPRRINFSPLGTGEMQ